MNKPDCHRDDSYRGVPRRGPYRTLRAATVGPLRSGPQRLYPRRGSPLPTPGISPKLLQPKPESDLKTIHP